MPSLIVYLQMASNAFATNTLKDRKPGPWVKKYKFKGMKTHPKNHPSPQEFQASAAAVDFHCVNSEHALSESDSKK
jgi:hypothetical protein